MAAKAAKMKGGAEMAALQERLARAEAKERSCRAKAAVEAADAGPTPDADAPTMLATEVEGYEEGLPDELQRMQVLNEAGELVDKPPLDEAEQKRPMAEHDAHLAGLAKAALAHRRKGRYKAAAASRLEALSYARNVHRARAQGLADESVTPEAARDRLSAGLRRWLGPAQQGHERGGARGGHVRLLRRPRHRDGRVPLPRAAELPAGAPSAGGTGAGASREESLPWDKSPHAPSTSE